MSKEKSKKVLRLKRGRNMHFYPDLIILIWWDLGTSAFVPVAVETLSALTPDALWVCPDALWVCSLSTDALWALMPSESVPGPWCPLSLFPGPWCPLSLFPGPWCPLSLFPGSWCPLSLFEEIGRCQKAIARDCQFLSFPLIHTWGNQYYIVWSVACSTKAHKCLWHHLADCFSATELSFIHCWNISRDEHRYYFWYCWSKQLHLSCWNLILIVWGVL